MSPVASDDDLEAYLVRVLRVATLICWLGMDVVYVGSHRVAIAGHIFFSNETYSIECRSCLLTF